LFTDSVDVDQHCKNKKLGIKYQQEGVVPDLLIFLQRTSDSANKRSRMTRRGPQRASLRHSMDLAVLYIPIKQIGDHALPQRGYSLGTPEGAEGGGATPGDTRPGRQRERAQESMDQTSSKHTFTSRHGFISNRSPNQKDIAGKHRADSGTSRAGKADKKQLQKGSRSHGMQKLGDILL
jgi:hypothetical protein